LVEPAITKDWRGSILAACKPAYSEVYFVHSFSAHPLEEGQRIADVIYGGHRICAAIQHENITATQFHPERSGEVGLEIIKNFLKK
jgi:glutamine amidotransferase